MSIPGASEPLIAGSAGGEDYKISRSLRFNSGDSPYLEYPLETSGNQDVWTWSTWVKRNQIGVTHSVFCGGIGANGHNRDGLLFLNDDTIAVYWRASGTTQEQLKTTQRFRDVASWYHLCWVFDYLNAGTAATDKSKLFVNGKLVSDWDTTFTASVSRLMNHEGQHFWLGKTPAGDPANIQLAETYFVDGYKATNTAGVLDDFGEINADTGVWIPKALDDAKWTSKANTTINNGTTWSTYLTSTNGWWPNFTNLNSFDGSPETGNYTEGGSNAVITFEPPG